MLSLACPQSRPRSSIFNFAFEDRGRTPPTLRCVMTSSEGARRNIVFVHPDLGIGGAERLVIDAAVGLQSAKHNVTILTSHCDRQHCFEEARDGELTHSQMAWHSTSDAKRSKAEQCPKELSTCEFAVMRSFRPP